MEKKWKLQNTIGPFAFRADCTLHENAVHGDEWWCLQGGQPPLGRRGIRYMKIAVKKAEEAKKK